MRSLVNKPTNPDLGDTKRKKIDEHKEAVVKCDSDTKIRLNQYTIEQFENNHNEYPPNLVNFESEMNGNQTLNEIASQQQDMPSIPQMEPSGITNLYESSELKLQNESIEDFMSSKAKLDHFPQFNMLQNDSQMESNLNLMSNNQDWKADSINFNEPKQMRTIEKIKIETNEEPNLLKDVNQPESFIDQF